MTGEPVGAATPGADGLPGPVVAIVGPTASGKSALADALARSLGSAVVSVDAMQVYRGMDVGTAKEPASRRTSDLMMVDVVDPGEDYSVRLFQRDARACVDGLLARDLVPVLCGGTGLYLDAVVDRMDFPAGGQESPARRRYEAFARDHGAEALHYLLVVRDPRSAALIHPNNVRRVVRALELLDEGKSYSQVHEGLGSHDPFYETLFYAVVRDRQVLYERIDARVDLMFEEGLVDEVRGLLDRGLLRPETTASQAIGYKEVVAALSGQTSMEEARDLIKRNSRRYAKRQLSWIRRDGRAHPLDLDRMGVDRARDLVLEDLRLRAGGARAAGQGGEGEGHGAL